MSPHALTGHVARAAVADRVNVAEQRRLAAQARPAGRSVLALFAVRARKTAKSRPVTSTPVRQSA